MSYAFPPAAPASLAVAGSDDRIPVRRVFCIGRNYAEHAREMGNDPDREPPFFFGKPADAVIDAGNAVPYPPLTENLHYEAELVVVLGKGGADIPEADALDHVWGYGAGNDLTRRDLQAEAKKMGRPWDAAKGFDNSAVIAPIHPVAQVGHLSAGRIAMTVNGALRQDGNLSEMIWSVPELIATLARSVTLWPGDVILTGTPAGVGALAVGDVCEVTIDGLTPCRFTIAPPL